MPSPFSSSFSSSSELFASYLSRHLSSIRRHRDLATIVRFDKTILSMVSNTPNRERNIFSLSKIQRYGNVMLSLRNRNDLVVYTPGPILANRRHFLLKGGRIRTRRTLGERRPFCLETNRPRTTPRFVESYWRDLTHDSATISGQR